MGRKHFGVDLSGSLHLFLGTNHNAEAALELLACNRDKKVIFLLFISVFVYSQLTCT